MLVYVGAVMVLFLFVVMMLDINVDACAQGFWKHFPLAAGVGALIALEMAAVLMGGFRLAEEPRHAGGGAGRRAAAPTPRSWASCSTPQYLYPLEIAAVILLVAIIAAIALTLRTRKDSKYIDPSRPGARARRATACASSRWPPTRAAPAGQPAARRRAAAETKA